MNSLHLFAGIGGGILADKILGHRIIGAVEIEPYCRAVLKQRQEEGLLEPFPLFDDIRTFKGDEITERIDLICGGFPCQDISTAGKGKGVVKGEKSSLFFELVRVCRDIRPKYIFLENSPAITGRGLGAVLNEIAKIGYDAEWFTLSAGECGAPHLRNRWWCLCQRQDSDVDRERELQPERLVEDLRRRFSDLGKGNGFAELAGRDSYGEKCSCGDVSDAESNGLQGRRNSVWSKTNIASSVLVRASDGGPEEPSRMGREDNDAVQRGSGEGRTETQRGGRSAEADCEREICDSKSMGRGQGIYSGDSFQSFEKGEPGPGGADSCYGDCAEGTGENADATSERREAAMWERIFSFAPGLYCQLAEDVDNRIGDDCEERSGRKIADAEGLRREGGGSPGGIKERGAVAMATRESGAATASEGIGDDSLSGGTRDSADAESQRRLWETERVGREPSGTGSLVSRSAFSDAGGGGDSPPDGGRETADAASMGRDKGSDAEEHRRGNQEGFSPAGDSGIGYFPGWWEIEPPLGRVANGIPHRVDALKGLGNAQVPVCAALAFYLLLRRYCD